MISVITQQLIAAAGMNQIDELKNLLDQGADIHADKDDALRTAAFRGHFEIVKILIEHGANIHANDDEALRESACSGHLKVVKFLITQGANIHSNDDEALRFSANCGRLETVKFLVTNGANIHANDDDALRNAASRNHNDVWQVLSAFIQEEKLLVAASVSMPVLPEVVSVALVAALGSVPLVAAPVFIEGPFLLDASHPQRISIIKIKRSKI